jgi:hypothetical protein
MASSSGLFELTAGTVFHSDDVLVFVDVHDTTQSAQGTTKKILSTSLWANAQPITLAGGTVTVSTPVFQGTQTWNAGGVTFTAIDLNVTSTASAAGSLLINLRVGGTSQFKVDKLGNMTVLGTSALQALTATTGSFSSEIARTGTFGTASMDTVGLTVTLANNATTTFGAADYSVMEIAETLAFGEVASFSFAGGGSTKLVWQTGTHFTPTQGTVSSINITMSASVATIQNKSGLSITLRMNLRRL